MWEFCEVNSPWDAFCSLKTQGLAWAFCVLSFPQASSYQRDATGVLKEERLQGSQGAQLREITYT